MLIFALLAVIFLYNCSLVVLESTYVKRGKACFYGIVLKLLFGIILETVENFRVGYRLR